MALVLFVSSSLTTHPARSYQKAFGISPVVFGAVPSLHAATSICCGLFVARYSKGYRGLIFMWSYCFWMVRCSGSHSQPRR